MYKMREREKGFVFYFVRIVQILYKTTLTDLKKKNNSL